MWPDRYYGTRELLWSLRRSKKLRMGEIVATLHSAFPARARSTIQSYLSGFETYSSGLEIPVKEQSEPQRTYFVMYVNAMNLSPEEMAHLKQRIERINPSFNWQLPENISQSLRSRQISLFEEPVN